MQARRRGIGMKGNQESLRPDEAILDFLSSRSLVSWLASVRRLCSDEACSDRSGIKHVLPNRADGFKFP